MFKLFGRLEIEILDGMGEICSLPIEVVDYLEFISIGKSQNNLYCRYKQANSAAYYEITVENFCFFVILRYCNSHTDVHHNVKVKVI